MTPLNFEKALADLEATVEKLEKGGLSLNESLALFEKGVKLARFLREELGKAEKKVEILLKDEKGGLKAEPFPVEGDAETQPSGSKKDEDDDEDEGGRPLF
jgi:exodeoxyribonuclease VII small subunit